MRIIATARRVITPDMMATRTRRVVVPGPRSSGLHVQAINKHLGIAAGKLDDDDKSPFVKFSDTCYPLLPANGVFWEETCGSFYSELELLMQPCELERDDVFGTPDGLIPDGLRIFKDMGVEGFDEPSWWECKFTTKKEKPINECWMYIKQGLAYSAMSGIRRFTYDIQWICGNYFRPYQPTWTTTLVEFTEQECEIWWRNMMAAAKSGRVKEE